MKVPKERRPYKNKEELKGRDLVCYECRKPCHIKLDCPLLEKKKGKYERKKKALNAEKWSDSKCETNDEEEANLCLMVDSNHEEEDEVI